MSQHVFLFFLTHCPIDLFLLWKLWGELVSSYQVWASSSGGLEVWSHTKKSFYYPTWLGVYFLRQTRRASLVAQLLNHHVYISFVLKWKKRILLLQFVDALHRNIFCIKLFHLIVIREYLDASLFCTWDIDAVAGFGQHNRCRNWEVCRVAVSLRDCLRMRVASESHIG